MNPNYHLPQTLIFAFAFLLLLASCRSKPLPPAQETTLSIKHNEGIWIPVQYRDSNYLAFFDTGAPNMFPSHLIQSDYVDTTKSKPLKSFMSNEIITTYPIPSLPLKIGDVYTKEPFIRVPYSTINIGKGMVTAYKLHFNFPNSTLKLSNSPIPLNDPHKKDSVRFSLSWLKSGIPLIDIIAENKLKKRNNTFWMFDTGNLASYKMPNGDTVQFDMLILVRDFDKFYASNSIFASIRKYARQIPVNLPTRYDLYVIDTITINKTKYTNFSVVIMKNESILRKGHLHILGMGFVNRFSNLYIDKKQVILYNEE